METIVCYACDRPLKRRFIVKTSDDQKVFVGPDCWARVIDAAAEGYQPPRGGPRLFSLDRGSKRICLVCGLVKCKCEGSK